MEHEGKKYLRKMLSADGNHPVGGINVDVYEVLAAFDVTSQPIGHAIKKLLACGQRGKGSRLDDLIGAQAAISRAIDQEKRNAVA